MALIALGLSIYSFFLDLRRFFVGVFKEHHSFSSLFLFFLHFTVCFSFSCCVVFYFSCRYFAASGNGEEGCLVFSFGV